MGIPIQINKFILTKGELIYVAQWTEGIKPVEGAKIGLTVPSYMEIDSIEDLEPKEQKH